jgi:NAD(P)H-flavin reductase
MNTCKCHPITNHYIPFPVYIRKISKETPDVKTFKVVFSSKKMTDKFDYKAGQFAQVSILGIGEAPISITSSPSQKGFLEFTIRTAGKLTQRINQLKVGDTLHIRGPYGNAFPFNQIKGKNIYFIAGGIGLAPLRSLINLVFDNREDFKHIKILYGARHPNEICSKEELNAWKKIDDTEVWLTVDESCDGWDDCVGVVTELWKETRIDADNAAAVLCGPPIMIKFVVAKLKESGFTDDNIIMTLERYMKCGIGKCGHCNLADKFVCVDGPVFTNAQVNQIPESEHVF